MRTSISPRLSASGHAGDLPGTYTWMLYNQTKDIGVIYLVKGNPGYGFLPLREVPFYQLILYSLFTKEGTLRGETHQEFKASFDPFSMRSLLEPQLMFY